MENRQINFFKSKDFNTVLKPFKKGTVVKIDSFDIRENQNELKIGLFGWYAICPSKELKKNKLFFRDRNDDLLFLSKMQKINFFYDDTKIPSKETIDLILRDIRYIHILLWSQNDHFDYLPLM